MKIMRAYKYRLYPTPEQEARLSAWGPLCARSITLLSNNEKRTDARKARIRIIAVNVFGNTADVERAMIGRILSLTCERRIDVQPLAALTIPPGVMHGP